MGLVGPIIGVVILIDGISKDRGFLIVLGLTTIGYGVFMYKNTEYPWDERKSSPSEAPPLESMGGSAPPPIPRPTEVPPPISKPIGVTKMEQHERNLEHEILRNSDVIQETEATAHPRSEFITRSDMEYPRLEEYLKLLGLPGTFKNPDANVEAAMHEQALAYIEKHYITLSSSATLTVNSKKAS